MVNFVLSVDFYIFLDVLCGVPNHDLFKFASSSGDTRICLLLKITSVMGLVHRRVFSGRPLCMFRVALSTWGRCRRSYLHLQFD